MDRGLWCLLTCAAIAAALVTAAAGTGCRRKSGVDTGRWRDLGDADRTDQAEAETPAAPMPPSPSPRPSSVPQTLPTTAPAATTAPATSPATRPAANPEELRSVRAQFTEMFEQIELFRREVAELQLGPDMQREVKGLFDRAASEWAQAEAELDSGQLPTDEWRADLAQVARDTGSKVSTVLGPERSIQLAAYRQTPRGGGQRFVSRLRVALETLQGHGAPLTPQQSPAVESVLEQVRKSVEKLPAQDAATFEAEQAVRRQVQAVIEEARAKLSAVLTPAQMAHVVRQVPSLAKQVERKVPMTKPQ